MSEPFVTTTQLIVPETSAGDRLDKVLSNLVPDLSRSAAKAMIEQGDVTLNGLPCHVSRQVVKAEDVIEVVLPDLSPALPEPEEMALDLLYEDDHVLVLNKPAGLTVHPGAGINTGTLVNGLLAHTKGTLSFKGGAERPGIVHRLDKETSGVMVVAKTDAAYDSLTAQFADHGLTGPLERAYQALIWGRPYHLHGQIDAPLGRSTKSRTKMAVVKEGEGRHAITNYEVVETIELGKGLTVSEVICRLETGRTHQIRVHFAHLKCPVLGDPVYGPGFITKSLGLAPHQKAAFDALGRQALHAFSLSFEHPETGEALSFETEAPEDYRALYDALKS